MRLFNCLLTPETGAVGMFGGILIVCVLIIKLVGWIDDFIQDPPDFKRKRKEKDNENRLGKKVDKP